MKIKISVVIPIYNSEKFLRKCLDSVINQTLKEIQIILVNDGSTDKSEEICLEYVKNYSNVEYYYKSNSGPAATRNYGINKAHGEYIGFIDSDDCIDNDMYKTMYETACENDIDIVCCRVKDDENLAYIYPRYGKFSKNEMKNELYPFLLPCITKQKTFRSIRWSNCNKIYKKIIIDKYNIRSFEKSKRAEDLTFDFACMMYANSFYYLDKQFYNNIRREKSVSQGYVKDLWIALKGVCNHIRNLSLNYSEYNFANQISIATFYFSVLSIENALLLENKNDAICEINNIINDEICYYGSLSVNESLLNKKWKKLHKCIVDKNSTEIYKYYKIRQIKRNIFKLIGK